MSRAKRLGRASRERGRGATTHASPRDSVLVVSDDPAFRLSVAVALDAMGYRAMQDALGAHVLRHLRPQTSRHESVIPLEALVVDISSSPKRGLNVLQALRAEDPEIPILVVAPPYDPALYDAIVRSDPAVVFEGPVTVEVVVVTTMNLTNHGPDTLRLAG